MFKISLCVRESYLSNYGYKDILSEIYFKMLQIYLYTIYAIKSYVFNKNYNTQSH